MSAVTASADRKRLVILGSTGSIGVQALQVAERLGYTVTALAAGHQVQPLEACLLYTSKAPVAYLAAVPFSRGKRTAKPNKQKGCRQEMCIRDRY